MEMPKMRPIPIETKGKLPIKQFFTWVTSIRQWEIVENWEHDLPNGDRMVVPSGFVFDGASIPRPLWAILSPTGLLLIQGLVHDYGYRYDYIWVKDGEGKVAKKYQGSGQAFWDELFLQVGNQVNGIGLLNAMAKTALTLFGSMAWDDNRAKSRSKDFKELYP